MASEYPGYRETLLKYYNLLIKRNIKMFHVLSLTLLKIFLYKYLLYQKRVNAINNLNKHKYFFLCHKAVIIFKDFLKYLERIIAEECFF